MHGSDINTPLVHTTFRICKRIKQVNRNECMLFSLWCSSFKTLNVTNYKTPNFFNWRCAPTRAMGSSFLRFLDHTQRRITVGMTPLDEWSARRRDLYLTTHNTHNRQTSMTPVRFEPTISACERPQTYALDRAATGTGKTPIDIYSCSQRQANGTKY